ncbi:MAG: hypothetical protein EHM35_05375 [Planctomycetaceae bacterium]|nr:MAG: hypothetical protein EHM35_05375 [Planctomycetaceae bacterium]
MTRSDKTMHDKEPTSRDPLPENFQTLDELWSFWDTHSSADYEDLMEPVEAEIDLSSSKVYCPVAKDLLREVRTRARQQGVSTETLINLWLQEKNLCFVVQGASDNRKRR